MSSDEVPEDWRSIVEREMRKRSELDQEIITALLGLDDGIRRDHDEVLKMFYRRGLTGTYLNSLTQEMARWFGEVRDDPDRLPDDYYKPSSKADRARFQLLDKLGISLAEKVTGLPARFVSSSFHLHAWGPKGFSFDIEAEDSGGQVPIHIEVDPNFGAMICIVDITGGHVLHVYGAEFDEEIQEFQVVGEPQVMKPGFTQKLSSGPPLDLG